VADRILTAQRVGDQAAYDRQAADLASRFEANFKQFDTTDAVRAAGPAKIR